LFLYNTKAKGCTTGKGHWYVSAVKGLAMEWLHKTFGKRNVVERFLGMLGMEPSMGWFAFLCCHLYHHGAKKLTSSVYKKNPLYGLFMPDFGEFFKVEVYKVNKECFRLLDYLITDLHLTKTDLFWKRNILAGALR